MPQRFLTGLDWSGDPGDPRKTNRLNTRIVVATCTVDLGQHELLDAELHAVRRHFGFEARHVFRHADSRPSDREVFFRAISEMPIGVACICIDKRAWSSDYLKSTTGPERIRHMIERLVLQIDEAHISGQKLLVDMTRDEKSFVTRIRQDLTAALKTEGRSSFSKVVARPDHRPDAAVIQVADMFAGEVRARGVEAAWGNSGRLIVFQE